MLYQTWFKFVERHAMLAEQWCGEGVGFMEVIPDVSKVMKEEDAWIYATKRANDLGTHFVTNVLFYHRQLDVPCGVSGMDFEQLERYWFKLSTKVTL